MLGLYGLGIGSALLGLFRFTATAAIRTVFSAARAVGSRAAGGPSAPFRPICMLMSRRHDSSSLAGFGVEDAAGDGGQ